MKQEYLSLADKAIQEKDVSFLCKTLFDVELYPTQEEIVKDIAFQENKRIILNCYTRYGKTFAAGIGLALYLYLNKKEFEEINEFRIGILGPRDEDAERVRKEFLKAGIKSDKIKEMLDTSRGSDPEDLVKSSNKNMLTFMDGTVEVHSLSAQSGKSGDGSGVMGDGVDILIIDESNRISHDFWKSAGNRLLEHEDAVLIEMGNPKHKDNQFFMHWNDESFTSYHVGEEKGISEGRHTRQWFDDKASEYPQGRQSIDYKILYKSEFPDQIEDGLTMHSWLDSQDRDDPGALQKNHELENAEKVYGFDVAGSGKDKAVLIKSLKDKDSGKKKTVEMWVKDYSRNTMGLAGWASDKIEKDAEVNIDSIGIGEGVADRLKELGHNINKVNVGEAPSAEKDRFVNKKAQYYWNLRSILENGELDISLDDTGNLVHELTHISYEFNSRGKIKIVDPQSGSPDYADALMLCFAPANNFFIA